MSPARSKGQKPPTANQAPESGTFPAPRAFSQEGPTDAGPWVGASLDAGTREFSAVPKSRAELPQPGGGRPFEPDSIQQTMEAGRGDEFSQVDAPIQAKDDGLGRERENSALELPMTIDEPPEPAAEQRATDAATAASIRREALDATPVQRDVESSAGANQIGVPTPVLQPMEQVIGHDFSRVRVHPDSPKALGLSPTLHRMANPPQGGTDLQSDLMGADLLQMKDGGPSTSAVVQFTKDNIEVGRGMTKHYEDHFELDLPSSDSELIKYVSDYWDEFEQNQDNSAWYSLELGEFETKRDKGGTSERNWSISLQESSSGKTYITHYGPYSS